MTISNEEKKQLVKHFMENYEKDNSRYRSYDYAREAFITNRDKVNNEKVMDYVALNLFAYLGSWGMICRGNFLMQKDYKFFIPVVKTLYKYAFLCDVDVLLENFDRNTYVSSVMNAIDELKHHFIGVEYLKYGKKEEKRKDITDTVIGKILMVTLGCLPAYDEYVKFGMGKEKIRQTLSETSVNGLIDYCLENKNTMIEISENITKITNLKYPTMKILDMIFWEYGLKHKEKTTKK